MKDVSNSFEPFLTSVTCVTRVTPVKYETLVENVTDVMPLTSVVFLMSAIPVDVCNTDNVCDMGDVRTFFMPVKIVILVTSVTLVMS
jgi:hypothetical protein